MQMPREEQVSPFDQSEQQALATFSHAAEERRFLREHQWQITNYVLIAYAALTAAPEWLDPDSCWRSLTSLFAIVLMSLAGVQGWRVMLNERRHLNRERERLDAAQNRLPLIGEIPVTGHPPRNRGLFAAVFLGWVFGSLINLSRIPSVQHVCACISQSGSGGSWPSS
jgi:hypothetical protein